MIAQPDFISSIIHILQLSIIQILFPRVPAILNLFRIFVIEVCKIR